MTRPAATSAISFRDYLRQLVTVVLSSALALGTLCALWLLFAGGGSADIGIDIEFGRLDGLWLLLGLPILLTLLLLLVSPLSWAIHRLLFRPPRAENR